MKAHKVEGFSLPPKMLSANALKDALIVDNRKTSTVLPSI